MKSTIYICDRCKVESKQERDVMNLSIFKDRVMDAAGSMENIYESADFCCKCMKCILDFLVDKSEESRELTLELIKNLKMEKNT